LCRGCYKSFKSNTCPLCRCEYEEDDRNPEDYRSGSYDFFTTFRSIFQEEEERRDFSLFDLFHGLVEYNEDEDDERSTNSGDDMTAEQLEEQNTQLIETLAERFEPVRDDPHLFPYPEDYPEGDSDY
jgi:hypothetical protein